MTLILVSLGVGAAVGAAFGWKMGRGYERVRPTKKKVKKRAKV